MKKGHNKKDHTQSQQQDQNNLSGNDQMKELPTGIFVDNNTPKTEQLSDVVMGEVIQDQEESSLLMKKYEKSAADMDTEDSLSRDKKMTGLKLYKKLYETYDNTYLKCFACCQFYAGLKTFVGLSTLDLMKDYMKIEPAEMQIISSLIALPWCFKIIYGLMSDNIPIFGTRRKGYIIINSFCSVIALAFMIPTWFENKYALTLILSIVSLNGAFINVIMEALMVQQSRRDPVNGSQDLNSYSYFFVSVGGILGSLMAAFLTQYTNPHFSFAICSIMALTVAFYGWKMSLEAEGITRHSPTRHTRTFTQELKNNISHIFEALKIPSIYKTLLYYVLGGLLVPSFGDVGYYFQLNVVQFSKFTYSMLNLISYICLFLGTILYKKCIQDWEFRTILQMSQFLGLIGCLCNLAFALRLNVKYGIDDLTFVILLSIFGETTALAFTLLPTLVLFAKITPHHIEATVFALLTGTYNLANNVGSPLIGSFFCKWYGVDSNHLDKYSDLIIIQIVAVCFGFLYIFLVPKRKEIDALLMQEIQSEKKEHEEEEKEDIQEEGNYQFKDSNEHGQEKESGKEGQKLLHLE